MLGSEEHRLRRRNANKRSAQKMRDQRQAELEQLRKQMDHANQVTGFMLHQIAELETHKTLLTEASQHYHRLCQASQAEGHQLSAQVAKLTRMVQVSSRSNLASSEPSKPFCETHTQPNSALTSELVQPNQSFLPHSSALSLEAALLSIRSCQCGSGVPSHTDQTNFIFGQHSSVLPSELGSPSEKPCQRVSTLMDLAQPTQIPSSQSSAQPWDFSQPTVALCQHSSEFSDTFQACDSLSNVLTEDLPTTDLPALGDLTEGSALLSQLEFDIAQTHELL